MTQTHATHTDLAHAACHTTISCADIGAVKAFYTDTLGLHLLRESAEEGIMLEAGEGTRLYVYPRPDFHPPENTVCSFHVDDLDATVAGLREHGVTFEEYDLPGLKTENGIATMGDIRGAWFKDPAGNVLAVSTL